MKRFLIVLSALVAAFAAPTSARVRPEAPEPAQAAPVQPNMNVPKIPFDSVPDYFKYPATMNLGEVKTTQPASR